MRAVVQRVNWAEVEVDGKIVGRVETGLLVYVGVAEGDTQADAERLAVKVAGLRIFPDEGGRLNVSVQDGRGGVLAIPNFTLLADARKGRRPTFDSAASQQVAQPVYDAFVAVLRKQGCQIECGVFGADMKIRSQADGPVNIIIDMAPRVNCSGAYRKDQKSQGKRNSRLSQR
ncbi:MAG: D-aminoacyl-tRNA deacylase [Planctomycetota bacterium]|jgi:D-tyrosyl-tRNA(Tyr) deacylase